MTPAIVGFLNTDVTASVDGTSTEMNLKICRHVVRRYEFKLYGVLNKCLLHYLGEFLNMKTGLRVVAQPVSNHLCPNNREAMIAPSSARRLDGAIKSSPRSNSNFSSRWYSVCLTMKRRSAVSFFDPLHSR